MRPKQCLLAVSDKLRNIVASKLILNWSPEQISGCLKIQFPDDASMRVSHETIHRSLFIQARGVLKKELMDHLRSKRCMRRSRHATVSGQARGQMVDAISIRERPAEVEDRAIPGHWEGDLLSGAKYSYIATLVERHSRFAMLIRVRSKETEVVVTALSRHVRKLPATLKRSLVGPWTGDGETRGLDGGYRCAGFISAIRKAPGNAARMKTPICSYGNTSRVAPICRAILKSRSTWSRCS